MVKVSWWYAEALRVIHQAKEEAAAEGLDGPATLRLVDSRYPFGRRAMWPYKQWLKARRRLCGRLLKPRDPVDVDPNFWAKLIQGDRQA